MTAAAGPLGRRQPVAGGLDVDLPGRGVRLRGTRWPGDGTPVLLLHGLASTRHVWDLVVPGLEGRPVVALDQRGHGDAERPGSGYGFDDVVADVLTALDALALSRVVVVGHSWGAWTALALAAASPERVLAVVAVDGGLSRPGGRTGLDPQQRAEARRRMEPPRFAVDPDVLLARIREGALAEVWDDDVAQSVLAVFETGPDGLARARFPFDAHMQVVDAMLDHDPHAVLDRVACPVWAVSCEPVGGADDPWAYAKEEGLAEAARRLARPRLLRWAGAVHDVPLQWPDLVAGVIRSAVAEAERAPSVPVPERPAP